MKHRKGMLIGPLPTSASLTSAIVFFSRQRMHGVLDSIWPVFCMPVHGAALVSGNTHGTSPLAHCTRIICCRAAWQSSMQGDLQAVTAAHWPRPDRSFRSLRRHLTNPAP